MTSPDIVAHIVIGFIALGISLLPGDIQVGRALSSNPRWRVLSKSRSRWLRAACLGVGLYAIGVALRALL